MNTWLYQNQPITDLTTLEPIPIGFVYLITNTITGKMYYGKKSATFQKTTYKTVTLKDGTKKKKKIRTAIQSDWQEYYGSSESLMLDVKTLGTEHFKREILRLCYSKAELSYYELKFQIENDVLLHPDLYYNSWISARIHGKHLKPLHSVLQ